MRAFRATVQFPNRPAPERFIIIAPTLVRATQEAVRLALRGRSRWQDPESEVTVTDLGVCRIARGGKR